MLTSHSHALFRNDNGELFDDLEVALRGTKYSSTVVRYKESRNGLACYQALTSQHAGTSVWESRIREAEDYLNNRKWTGTSSVTLEHHIDKHRTSFIIISEAREHVTHQLPEERTRVTNLINSITSKDSDVVAALAVIKQPNQAMRDNFELAAAYILPTCPVARRKTEKGQQNAEVAAVNPTLQTGKGTSGVELRYYPTHVFRKLPEAQQKELKAWAATNPRTVENGGKSSPKDGKGGGKSNKRNTSDGGGGHITKKKLKGMVSSIMKEAGKSNDDSSQFNDFAAALKGMVTAAVASATAKQQPQAQGQVGSTNANPQDLDAHAQTMAVCLQKIAGKSKKGKKGKDE